MIQLLLIKTIITTNDSFKLQIKIGLNGSLNKDKRKRFLLQLLFSSYFDFYSYSIIVFKIISVFIQFFIT